MLKTIHILGFLFIVLGAPADQTFETIIQGDSVSVIGDKSQENDDTFRTSFSGASAPTDPAPVAGQLWFDTGAALLKFYNGSSFVTTAGTASDPGSFPVKNSTGSPLTADRFYKSAGYDAGDSATLITPITDEAVDIPICYITAAIADGALGTGVYRNSVTATGFTTTGGAVNDPVYMGASGVPSTSAGFPVGAMQTIGVDAQIFINLPHPGEKHEIRNDLEILDDLTVGGSTFVTGLVSSAVRFQAPLGTIGAPSYTDSAALTSGLSFSSVGEEFHLSANSVEVIHADDSQVDILAPLVATNTISASDGTAGSPSYTGTSTDDGLFFPSASSAGLSANGSERFRATTTGATVTGGLTVTSVVDASNGTVADPSYTGTSTNDGVYFPTGTSVAVSVEGAQVALFNASGVDVPNALTAASVDATGEVEGATIATDTFGTGIDSSGNHLVPNGTAALPSIHATSDVNTGISFDGADKMLISANGSEIIDINTSFVELSNVLVVGSDTVGPGSIALNSGTTADIANVLFQHDTTNEWTIILEASSSDLDFYSYDAAANIVEMTATDVNVLTDLDMSGDVQLRTTDKMILDHDSGANTYIQWAAGAGDTMNFIVAGQTSAAWFSPTQLVLNTQELNCVDNAIMAANVTMSGLGTTDPAVASRVWNSNGDLRISSGTAVPVETYGGLYWTSTAATSITAGQPIKAAGTTASIAVSATSDITISTSNRITYTGTRTKVFQVEGSISPTSSVSNQTMQLWIYKSSDGSAPAPSGQIADSEIQRRIGTGSDVAAIPIGTLVSLATNDYVELYLDLSINGNVTIEKCNLRVHAID